MQRKQYIAEQPSHKPHVYPSQVHNIEEPSPRDQKSIRDGKGGEEPPPGGRFDHLGSMRVHDEVYSLRALAAAVTKLTDIGGHAYLMNAKGRPGVERLADMLADAGEVISEELTLVCAATRISPA